MIPTLPEGASSEEHEAAMSKMDGKEWAIVDFHSSMDANIKAMVINMIRGLLVNILIVYPQTISHSPIDELLGTREFSDVV